MVLLLLALACTPDPGAGKPAAKVEAPPPAAAPAAPPPAAPAAPARAFTIDVTQFKLQAVGAKVTGSHTLTFGTWSGSAQVAGDQLTSLTVKVDMNSLNTEPAKLLGHLKTPDFFDVAGFPEASFTSAEIKPGENGTFTVSGDLTMRGTTKRISFPATITVAGDQLNAKADFSINRKDFGIVYPGKPDDLIADNVALTVELVGEAGLIVTIRLIRGS